MSEQKVLSKYYPPDFDPKNPRTEAPQRQAVRGAIAGPLQPEVKIDEGRKFDARRDGAERGLLGLPVFRLCIKCARCRAEITFKTDPENTDYAAEHGATCIFQAKKLLEAEKRVQKEREDEELNNRTKDSKLEMEFLENLQELKDLSQQQAHAGAGAREDEKEAAALVEEARKQRLLETPIRRRMLLFPPRPALLRNPIAIREEAPKAKRKVESWERSVAPLAAGPNSLGLGAVKKTDLDRSTQQGQEAPALGTVKNGKAADPAPQTPGPSSQSQLGAYSDSEDSSGSNCLGPPPRPFAGARVTRPAPANGGGRPWHQPEPRLNKHECPPRPVVPARASAKGLGFSPVTPPTSPLGSQGPQLTLPLTWR
ncbi:hypothetical protein HPG69_000685 [Diceros bicornis minor]|uniref:Splicing factor YJU2 n=1 Tax=Diceros bicornis minor TaxID=77932 RepID=A0A7J7FIB6_DICBM|nr:hypothetical protein HPG69_000685 [Diceros bicornis minor]